MTVSEAFIQDWGIFWNLIPIALRYDPKGPTDNVLVVIKQYWSSSLTRLCVTRARFLSLTRSKLRLCSANHRTGYFSNLACDWLSIVWAYSEQETEIGPRSQWFHQETYCVSIEYARGHGDFCFIHDDVIKWKYFPRYLPFVRGNHRSPSSDAELWCFIWSAPEPTVEQTMYTPVI